MSLSVQRMGDVNDGGGAITAIPQTTVFANGLLVAVIGSVGTSHPPCHWHDIHCEGKWQTTGGSQTVFIGGLPVNRLGDVDTCGHQRIGGSNDIFVG